MRQKSLVLARYPFSNQVDYKIRPALIVSNDRYNARHPAVWVVPFTTKQTLADFEIEVPPKDIIQGKIDERSFVRTDQLVTLENDLILKEIGRVSDAFFDIVRAAVKRNMD